jgi:hypothetical protein
MLNYKPKKKISFLGDVIIIIVLFIFAYFIYNGFANAEIKEINEINNKHLIYTQRLIPTQKISYIEELKSLDSQYTKPIIKFIELQEDTKRLDDKIKYDFSINNCIKEKRITELNIINNRKSELLQEFKDLYNSRLDSIYWNSYIEVLNNYNIDKIKIDINPNLC